MPETGFPYIKAIDRIIKTNIENYSFGQDYEEAIQMSDLLDKTIEKIDLLLDDPLFYIYESINKLKNDVESKREGLKLIIDDQADKLIKELDEYELQCRKNIESEKLNTEKNNLFKLVKEANENLDKWSQLFSEFNSEQNWLPIKQSIVNLSNRIKIQNELFKFNLLMEDRKEISYTFAQLQIFSQKSNNSL